MNMDDFESKLRGLTPSQPSAELRRRIFGPERKRRSLATIVSIRIPLNLAATLALAAGLGGFFTAQLGKTETKQADSVSPNVQVIYQQAPTTSHLFDFSTTPNDFLPKGDYEVKTNDNDEV
jgi:hypothetical protein